MCVICVLAYCTSEWEMGEGETGKVGTGHVETPAVFKSQLFSLTGNLLPSGL